jgi:hypothetical protein
MLSKFIEDNCTEDLIIEYVKNYCPKYNDDFHFVSDCRYFKRRTRTFTEDGFIEVITHNLYNLFEVGDHIKLKNALCNEFVVIGKDHQRDSDTIYRAADHSIDIMPITQVGTCRFSDDNSDNYYANSIVREWINDVYINHSGFSDIILGFMKPMSVYDTKTKEFIYDKAKLLSYQELGIINYNECMENEETDQYPYFIKGEKFDSNDSRKIPLGKYGNYYYWTRSRVAGIEHVYNWCITGAGICVSSDRTNTYGIVPVLRF